MTNPTAANDCWFLFGEHNLLLVHSTAPTRHPARYRVGGGPFEPLAELTGGPGFHLIGLRGLPNLSEAREWNATGPGGSVRFAAHPPALKPRVEWTGSARATWSLTAPSPADRPERVGVAAVAFPTGSAPVFHREHACQAHDGFPLPPEWLGPHTTELLFTPIWANDRRGPTERLVLAGRPREAIVRVEEYMIGPPRQERRVVRVVCSPGDGSGATEFEIRWWQRQLHTEALPVRVRAESQGEPVTSEFPGIAFGDVLTIRAVAGADGGTVRFLVSTPQAPGAGPRTVEPEDARPTEYVFRHDHAEKSARPPSETVRLLESAVQDVENLADTALVRGLNPEDRRRLAALPGAVLVPLARLLRDEDRWRAAREALGAADAQPLSEYLKRPHEFALATSEHRVCELIRRKGRPGDGARSVRALLVPVRQSGLIRLGGATAPDRGEGIREHLDRADDAEIDAWVEALIAGASPAEVYARTAGPRGWRPCPADLPDLLAALRSALLEPLAPLAEETSGTLGDLVREAVAAEAAALAPEAPADRVRGAAGLRRATVERVRGALTRAAPPPEHRPKLEEAGARLAENKPTAAAAVLAALRVGAPAGAPLGVELRVEGVWAIQAALAEEELRERGRRAADWCTQLFLERALPPWPLTRPPTERQNLRTAWEQLQPALAAGAVPRELVPAGFAEAVAGAVRAVRETAPDGHPSATVLDAVLAAGNAVTPWLAAGPARQSLAASCGNLVARLESREARAQAAMPLGALTRGPVPREWATVARTATEIEQLAEDETVWRVALERARANGLSVPEGIDAAVEWFRNPVPPAPASDPAAGRAEALLRILESVGVSVPGDSAGANWVPVPGPRGLAPEAYSAFARWSETRTPGAHAARRAHAAEAALRDWWRRAAHDPGADAWLDAVLAAGAWDRLATGARTLRALAGSRDEVGRLLLDDHNHSPLLSELLRYRSAGRWASAPYAEFVRAAAALQTTLADAPTALDRPDALGAIQVRVAQLRELVGPGRDRAYNLRSFLCDKLGHLTDQLRRLAPALPVPDTDRLRWVLERVAACENGTADVRTTELFRAVGLFAPEGVS